MSLPFPARSFTNPAITVIQGLAQSRNYFGLGRLSLWLLMHRRRFFHSTQPRSRKQAEEAGTEVAVPIKEPQCASIPWKDSSFYRAKRLPISTATIT
jgi:hypothetical protein